jgi:drug/metabolite transporter (DMT)-like permease
MIARMIYCKLALAALFWAAAFIFGRLIAGDIGPFSISFLRFAIAAGALSLTLAVAGGLRASRREMACGIVLGFFGVFGYNALFFAGLHTVSAARAALIVAINPVIIALAAALFFNEALGWRRILGVIASLKGALLVIAGADVGAIFSGEISAHEFYFVGCALCWAAYSLLGKRWLANASPLKMVWLASVFGAMMLAAPALIAEDLTLRAADFGALVWGAVLFTGLFSSALGFVWYYQGIAKIGAARAANFIYLVPPAAAALAWLALDETLNTTQTLGGALVLLGVYLVNRPPRKIVATP